MLAVDSVSAEGGSPVGVSVHHSPALSRARESPDNVRKMFGKCSELVGARARWASAMKEPTGTCSGNVRKMFGTGGCPLPCPSRGRGVPPTMFDSVQKMFGKCSECLQPCDSPGRPARQASSARHVRQPGHHWHWQPETRTKSSKAGAPKGLPETSRKRPAIHQQREGICRQTAPAHSPW